MKSLILAGGDGRRLRPITHTSAKQLVPVANKPILFYGLEAIVAAGIVDVGMIVGDTAEEVMAAVGDGSAFGAKVTYIRQHAPLGLAHCVLIAREFLGDDDFVMYLGDNLLEQDLSTFVSRFESPLTDEARPAAQILLKRVSDPERFGIVTVDEWGSVLSLLEKPDDPPTDLALVGVFIFDRTIHQAVAELQPSSRGELEITDAIQWLIDHGHRVRAEVLEGWWIDTGKVTPLLDANRILLERLETRIEGEVDELTKLDGRVTIDPGAVVRSSRIRGPVAIASGAVIEHSFIGPFTAIGERCHITNSEIEHSVVMEGSTIVDIPRLEDSLIGRDTTITRSHERPRAVRLVVGDHCQVDVE
jgi:glucose-1-phosphate thymidylyltransferase